MTVDNLRAALERRGYALPVFFVDEETQEVKMIARLGDRSMPWSISLSVLRTIEKGVENLIRHDFFMLNRGRAHRQCARCGEPLLVSFKYEDKEEQALKWYGCYNPKIGPYAALDTCPGCGILFEYPPPLKEFEDTYSK